MTDEQHLLEQFKDAVLPLPDGELIYEMIKSAYDIGFLKGCMLKSEIDEQYGGLLEVANKINEKISKNCEKND